MNEEIEYIWIKVKSLRWFEKYAYKHIDKDGKVEYWESEELKDLAYQEDLETPHKEKKTAFCYYDFHINSQKCVHRVEKKIFGLSLWGADIVAIEDYPEYRI